MNRPARLSVLTLGTAALLGAGLAPASAATAAVPGHAGVAPAATPSTVTSRVDIDGDGRADRTTLARVSTTRTATRYVLTVRTARGRTATLPIRIDLPNYPARYLWIGATGLDGVRGNEIVLDLSGGVGDFPWVHSYTWRNNKIVPLPAPGSTNRMWSWPVITMPFAVAGHTFSMKGNTRYVVKHDLQPSASRRSCSGTNTTYRWAATGWAKVATAKTGVIPCATADKKYAGFHGLIWR